VSQWRASIEIPIEPESASVARNIVGHLLRGWRLSELDDDLRLITSELVTNVYQHAPGGDSIELEIIADQDRVRVSLADGSTIKPVIREMDPSTPTGRGLRLVRALSSRWGADEYQGGKRVWVEVDLPHQADLAGE